jgi:hypothetical protein
MEAADYGEWRQQLLEPRPVWTADGMCLHLVKSAHGRRSRSPGSLEPFASWISFLFFVFLFDDQGVGQA